jgi:hypothetical protein
MRVVWAAAITLAAVGLACGGEKTTQPSPTNVPPSAIPTIMTSTPNPPTPVANAVAAASTQYAFTHVAPDGNRFIGGHGTLPDLQPTDVALNGTPAWVIGAEFGSGILWVAVLDDGRTQGFVIEAGTVSPAMVTPDRIPKGMPPLLKLENGEATLVTSPSASSFSPYAHPVPIGSSGGLAYLRQGGQIVLATPDGTETVLDVGALPDAKILTVGDELLLLGDRTSEYPHGALGDELEAKSIVRVGGLPNEPKVSRITLPRGDAIEGIAPIWADLSGDGKRDIVVTVSNLADGARLVMFDERGNTVAESSPIGTGFRWRHQIAVAPIGPSGEIELVTVRTPHIGGVVEFFAVRNGALELITRLRGYTSHRIGSRNLDMAVVGDFDGNQALELIVPTQDRQMLGAISRVEAGAEVIWELEIGGHIVTNIAAVRTGGDLLALAVGLEEGRLRIWGPE